MIINRCWAMPSHRTFQIKPIKELIERYIKPDMIIIDPFANDAQYGTLTNDLNPNYQTDYHLDGLAFLEQVPANYADLLLYDPPYSVRQAAECYNSFGKGDLKVTNAKYWSDCKKEAAKTVKQGGIAICFGWNSGGLGKKLGMEMIEVLMVPHGGAHFDTIVTVEIKK